MKIGPIELGKGAVLAPMAGVTDRPFREICAEYGAALTVTEMVSAKALFYVAHREAWLRERSPKEPCAALQLFGDDGELMADMAIQYGEDFELIDLNMGCPAGKIVKSGYGCSLMKDLNKASEIIAACARRIPKPVGVKIRKGWDETSVNAVEFARMAQDSGAAYITVHGRTREQFYSGKADWDILANVKNAVSIPVIGNGDIFVPQDAMRMLETTGVDMVMVGRGAQGNPWIFEGIRRLMDGLEARPKPDVGEVGEVVLRQAHMLAEQRGERLALLEMRKHMAWYTTGMPNAAQMRKKVFTITDIQELYAFAQELAQGSPAI